MMLTSLKESLLERGVNEHDSLTLKRKKAIFNILNLVGSTTAIPQIFQLYPYDPLSAFSCAAWGIIAILAFLLHGKIEFKTIRNITMFSVLILGNFGAMRIGPELYPHIPSLGLLFAAFIFYDLKTEKRYLIPLIIIQATCFFLTEFSVFQVAKVDVSNVSAHRSIVLIGTLIFLVIELYLFKDIIERSEAKVIQELQKSNNEKDILLKEIHHRVKNNLQLLSSLIRLRMNSEGNSIAEDQLKDINSRIRSIALLHNKVYLNESIQNIEFELFVSDLFNELKMNVDYEEDLKISVDSDLKETDLNNMVPLALILNELITNSFKHGMKDNDKKEICLEIKRIELNTYKMLYSDSGVWKEQPSETNSMGLSLINSLSEQLDGSFEILDTDNTRRKISQIIFTIS